jgi:hypothetical protein
VLPAALALCRPFLVPTVPLQPLPFPDSALNQCNAWTVFVRHSEVLVEKQFHFAN